MALVIDWLLDSRQMAHWPYSTHFLWVERLSTFSTVVTPRKQVNEKDF